MATELKGRHADKVVATTAAVPPIVEFVKKAVTSNSFVNACIATLALLVPLCLWRMYYPASDWAALALILLAAILLSVHWSLSASIYQARLHVALRADSSLSGFLTGRIWAILRAIAFLLVSILILAWQALVSSFHEIAALVALCVLASGSFAVLQSVVSSHFHQPFTDAIAVSLSTWTVALIFVPILAWINWYYVSHPGEILKAGFIESVMLGMENLPPRRGWIAEVLAPLYAIEAAKLWLVVQPGYTGWKVVLFSIDGTLVGFILARTSIVITLFLQHLRDEEEFK